MGKIVELSSEEISRVLHIFFRSINNDVFFQFIDDIDQESGETCVYAVLYAWPLATEKSESAVRCWNEQFKDSGYIFRTEADAICTFMNILNEQKESA